MQLQLVFVFGTYFAGFKNHNRELLSSVVVVRSQHSGFDSETVYGAAWSVRGLHF